MKPWAFRNSTYLVNCSELIATELSRCVFLEPFFATFRMAIEMTRELLLFDGKVRSITPLPNIT
jgi:hypothetical protein